MSALLGEHLQQCYSILVCLRETLITVHRQHHSELHFTKEVIMHWTQHKSGCRRTTQPDSASFYARPTACEVTLTSHILYKYQFPEALKEHLNTSSLPNHPVWVLQLQTHWMSLIACSVIACSCFCCRRHSWENILLHIEFNWEILVYFASGIHV